MKLIIYCILFVLLSFSSEAQTIRLPFLEGDKYSIIDENEKEVLPAEFDDVVIYEDFKVMSLQKGELWGIYTMDGRKILDHVIKGKNNYGKKGPDISKAFSTVVIEFKSVRIKNSLIIIHDKFANVNYYINPLKVLPNYKPYAVNVKDDPKFTYAITYMDNCLRVGNRDNSIMFIDSLGQEILNKPINGGYPLTNELFAVSDGDNYALYYLNEKKTEYLFTQIDPLSTGCIIKGTQHVLDDKGRKESHYTFFNQYGNVFKQSKEYPSSISTNLIINHENGFSLYDTSLKEIMSEKHGKASFRKLGSKSYIFTNNNYMNGLFDLNGLMILDTIYQSLTSDKGYLYKRKNDTFSVLDTNFQILIEMIGVTYLKNINNTEYFTFGKKENYYTKNGIINNKMEIETEPVWQDIRIITCENLVKLQSDSTWVIRKLGSSKNILEVDSRNAIEPNCYNKTFSVSSDSTYTIYDFEGNFIEQGALSLNQNKTNKSHSIYIEKDVSGQKMLYSKDEYPVIQSYYKNIDIITNSDKGQSIYIC